ncbi:type I polyketide synthase, partial [Hyalangium sp.]|uniref:type I polyketide synthase n=1 Tax=Hyalangium sp. TaxID=2028555 RepID=UPI002D5F9930
NRGVMLESLGALYTGGHPVAFERLYPSWSRPVELPSYAWQRSRHWLQVSQESRPGEAKRTANGHGHPFFVNQIKSARPSGERYFELAFDAASADFLGEHGVHRLPLLPFSTPAELVVAAASEAFKSGPFLVEPFTLHEALILDEKRQGAAQLVLTPRGAGQATFEVFSTPEDEGPPALLASGQVRSMAPGEAMAPEPVPLAEARARCREEVTGTAYFAGLDEAGISLGPSYRVLERLWRRPGEVLGLVRLSEERLLQAASFRAHPAVLELAVRLLTETAPDEAMRKQVLLPTRIERVRFLGRHEESLWIHVTLRQPGVASSAALEGDIRLLNEAGRPMVELIGVRLEKSSSSLIEQAADRHVRSWLYDLSWEDRSARGTAVRAVPRGLWIILADQGGTGANLAQQLEREGNTVFLASAGERAQQGAGHASIHPTRREDFEWLLEQAQAHAGAPLRGVVHLWALDAAPNEALELAELQRAQQLAAGSVIPLLQVLAPIKGAELPSVWLVTRGAQPAGEAESVAVAQSLLWGLGRVAALEHPDIWGGLIDLDPRASPGGAEGLVQELLAPDGEEQIALRAGKRKAARLIRASAEELTTRPRLREDATYLITGGLRGLGLDLARWMIDRGAKNLALLGRTELPPRESWSTLPADSSVKAAVLAVEDLEKRGAQVRVFAADVVDEPRMAAVLEQLRRELPPLRGVIHAAGLNKPVQLTELGQDTLDEVLGPKVRGTWVLDRLTRDMPIDFMVYLSSVASVWGAAWLGPYAAANHFLDAVAHYRRAAGRAAVAINLGTWAGGGMGERAADSAQIKTYFQQIGYDFMSPETTIEVLGRFVGARSAQKVVTNLDWSKFKPVFEARRRRPLLDRIEVEAPGAGKPVVASAVELLKRLAASPLDERKEMLEAHVRHRVAAVLGFEDPSALAAEQGFFQLGMDSVMSVRVRKDLESDFGRPLAPTVAFEHPTVRALASFLEELLRPSAEEKRAETAPAEAGAPEVDPAIAGLSEDELVALLARELSPAGVNEQ